MPQQTAAFDAVLEQVGNARRFCVSALAAWGLDSLEPAVSGVVTELATNCVLHARTAFSVTVSFDGQVLRVGVTDSSPRMPIAKSYSTGAMSGRGLRLVAAFADAWGVESHDDGKTVWASFGPVSEQPALDGDGAVPHPHRLSTAKPVGTSPAARSTEGEPTEPGATLGLAA